MGYAVLTLFTLLALAISVNGAWVTIVQRRPIKGLLITLPGSALLMLIAVTVIASPWPL